MSDQTLPVGRKPDERGASAHLEAGTVAAYHDDGLTLAQRASVDAHLSECDTCRAEVVEVHGIVRARRTGRWGWLAGIGVAAAAALLLFAMPKRAGLPGAGDVAAQADLAARVRALGAVAQPPIYLPVPVRAPAASGAELFMTGMREYGDARYPEAVTALRGAQAAGAGGAAAPFFLGASLLMIDDASGAAEAFARVIGMGETSYLAESHYYQAKALLRLNRPDSAVYSLDRAVSVAPEPIKTAARTLRDSLRLVLAR